MKLQKSPKLKFNISQMNKHVYCFMRTICTVPKYELSKPQPDFVYNTSKSFIYYGNYSLLKQNLMLMSSVLTHKFPTAIAKRNGFKAINILSSSVNKNKHNLCCLSREELIMKRLQEKKLITK